MKEYRVEKIARQTVIVEAESEEQALEEAESYSWEWTEANIESGVEEA